MKRNKGFVMRPFMIFFVLFASLSLFGVTEEGTLLFPNSDFEADGKLTNWNASGDAFAHQPTLGANCHIRERKNLSMHEGRYWIGTYEKYQAKPGQRLGDFQGNKPVGEMVSTGFIIEKPIISFLVGGGSSPHTGVQLLVNGSSIYTATGGDNQLMRRVYWDVEEYIGKKAMIYIYDRSRFPWGIVNADDFRYVDDIPYTCLFPNSDFEMGDLGNWYAEGDAFAAQPTKGDNVAVRKKNTKRAAPQGEYWIGTHERYQGKEGETAGAVQEDAPKGVLYSVPFKITGKAIAFRLGGGSECSVKLLVDGRLIHTAQGHDQEEMRFVVWNVSRFPKRMAEIRIEDNSDRAWGHINVDDFHWARQ